MLPLLLVPLAPACGGDDASEEGSSVPCPEGLVCGGQVEPPDARRARREAEAAAWALWNEGRSLSEIASALRERPEVLRVFVGEFSVVFDVEGARRQFIGFDTNLPETDLAWFESTHPREGQGLVVSKPSDQDEDEKTALLFAPFEGPSFPSRIPRAASALQALRDYDDIDLLRGALPLSRWSRFNEAHFVWVSSHGDHTVSEDDFSTEVSYIAAGGECGSTRVLRQNADRALAKGGGTWGDLIGRPQGQIINFGDADDSPLTAEEWSEIEDQIAENDGEETARGATCGTMPIVGGDGVRRHYTMWVLDEYWFETTYGSGLRDVFFYADVCSGDALPFGPGSGDFTYLGWTESLPIAHSNQVGDVLIEELIEEGLTVESALDAVDEAGLRETQNSAGETTRLELAKGSSDLRVREVVSLIEPTLGIPLEDGFIVSPIESDGDGTRFELEARIEGIEEDEDPSTYALSLHRIDPDRILVPDTEVSELTPTSNGDYRGVLTVETEPLAPGESVVLEARLTLAEGGESRHRVELMIEEAGEDEWSFTLGGSTTSGEDVSSIFAIAIPTDQGLQWPLTLRPTPGAAATPPFGQLVLVGHPGRGTDCAGPTGSYTAGFVLDDGRYLYGAEEVSVEITAFGIDGFSASVSGAVERADRNDPEGDPVEVPMTGTVEWARTGCASSPEPVDPDFIGSFRDPSEPAICIDLYTGSFIRSEEIFDETCRMQDFSCSDDPCPAEGRVARCDYRTQGAQAAFADTVQSFYPSADFTAEDLEIACTASGGRFVPN